MSVDAFYALPDLEQNTHRTRWYRKRETHSCGLTYEEHADPDRRLYVHRSVCRPTMKLAAMQARYEELYGELFHDGTFRRWSSKRSTKYPYAASDGVTFFVHSEDEAGATWDLPPLEAGGEGDVKLFVTPAVRPGG